MEMMVLFLVLIAFAVAAPRYGADSRTTLGASRATPAADLVALCRRLSAPAPLTGDGTPAGPGRSGGRVT
jgi:hypothetical protein